MRRRRKSGLRAPRAGGIRSTWRARILSPVDGVVVSRNVGVGQTVAASLQAPTLFTIGADLTRLRASASVSEADVRLVREGQPVTFTVDADPDGRFRGTVREVRLQPVVAPTCVAVGSSDGTSVEIVSGLPPPTGGPPPG